MSAVIDSSLPTRTVSRTSSSDRPRTPPLVGVAVRARGWAACWGPVRPQASTRSCSGRRSRCRRGRVRPDGSTGGSGRGGSREERCNGCRSSCRTSRGRTVEGCLRLLPSPSCVRHRWVTAGTSSASSFHQGAIRRAQPIHDRVRRRPSPGNLAADWINDSGRAPRRTCWHRPTRSGCRRHWTLSTARLPIGGAADRSMSRRAPGAERASPARGSRRSHSSSSSVSQTVRHASRVSRRRRIADTSARSD